MDVPPGSSLEGLLLPSPPGKDYRLVKVLTQEATEAELELLGNNRVPVVNRALLWNRTDAGRDASPPEGRFVWTTDFQTVRKGRWRRVDPATPLEEGKWEDEEGRPIPLAYGGVPVTRRVPPGPERRTGGNSASGTQGGHDRG